MKNLNLLIIKLKNLKLILIFQLIRIQEYHF
jgi:hypothetical protein